MMEAWKVVVDVVDASPIIGLAKAESLDLLRLLFGEVLITDAVHAEVLAGNDLPGVPALGRLRTH